MAKRFTDSDKWKDKWFRSLSPLFKLAWLYLLDNCDQAGVIELDEELADFQIGESVEWPAFFEACGERIERIESGKLWVVKFVPFQYGSKLSENCKAHNPVFQSLEKHSLPIPFPKGIERDQVKVKVKDKAKVKDKETAKASAIASKPDSVPDDVWNDWLKARRSKGVCSPTQTVISAIEREANAAGIDLATAIRVAAENSWASFRADWYSGRHVTGKRELAF